MLQACGLALGPSGAEAYHGNDVVEAADVLSSAALRRAPCPRQPRNSERPVFHYCAVAEKERGWTTMLGCGSQGLL